MHAPHVHVDAAAATVIVRAVLRKPLTVAATRPLRGGMISAVSEWTTDGEPRQLVAKLSPKSGNIFAGEYRMLRWFRAHTNLPVPEPYGCLRDASVFPGSCLLMERAPGRNLAEAQLTPAGTRRFQEQLAEHAAALHNKTRDTYGSALGGKGHTRWLDWFAPRMESNYKDARTQLSPRARAVGAQLLKGLDRWLPECHRPTLVHGDLWATNIIVDDADADHPLITAFVDGAALYCDVEYELAYLRVFDTVGQEFFDAYAKHHPLREGVERRCRVYWFNTMLLHLWRFGDEYAPACERLAEEIARLA
jgi:fructosamine-3-kinase